MRIALALSAVLALINCRGDETLTAYGAAQTDWQLVQIDGKAFDADATLRFGADGAVTGSAPCNTLRGVQAAPYPWFALEQAAFSRRACPDLPLEQAMMSALNAMTLAETGPGTLLLSNDAGREMLFRAAQ